MARVLNWDPRKVMQIPPTRRHGDGERAPEAPVVRLLLVDDDDNFRSWMALLMRRLGFTVETAVDGEQALAMLETGIYDLLMCDYQMPKLDGFDVIRHVRATPHLAQQYAVMLTSHDDIESKVAALTIGYDDFLTKNCTEVEVVAKVAAAKRMLSRQRTLSTAATEWQALATRDELTGVATRRSLVAEAERFLLEARAVGIALFDLDDFKPINDTFGHLTGDRILRDIGALFIRRTRAHDLIARYGGDEFVLLVPDLPVDDVSGAADRLRVEIESLQWTTGDIVYSVKVTSGIAHSSLLDTPSLNGLLEAADRDLYAKKWLKKNPGGRADLYDYPAGAAGRIVPLTAPPAPEMRRRTAEEEKK